jgi:5-formyltetrahydrofolate cyclo-ligase
MDEPLASKHAIRKRILDERLSICEPERSEKSSTICSAIENLQEYAHASAVLFYMPFRGEVDILPLMQKALLRGRTCALPMCAKDRSLRLFVISDIRSDVAPGKWGVPEPVEGRACECTGEAISVIIVPGVAFDRHGGRLGYGSGYYDKLLAPGGNGALKIAPAFAMQVVQELPHGPGDMPVDIIVTEEGIIDCRKAEGVYYG